MQRFSFKALRIYVHKHTHARAYIDCGFLYFRTKKKQQQHTQIRENNDNEDNHKGSTSDGNIIRFITIRMDYLWFAKWTTMN